MPDGGRAGEGQRRVLGEDRRLQPAQLGPGFEAELLDQQAATLLEHPQRIRLAPGAVQRQHQQPTQPLPQRMGRDELLELDDGALVPAQLELEIEPLLEQREP